MDYTIPGRVPLNLNSRHWLLIFLLGIALTASGCSNATSLETDTPNREYATTTLETFFPSISGNIADYSIQLPVGYEAYEIPSGFSKGELIWATPEDLKSIFTSDQNYDFSLATSPVFKIAFSGSVGVEDGQIITQGGAITQAVFEQQGIENINFKSGLFHGFPGVPVLAMSGTMEGVEGYMAYLYSPADDMVVLVVLNGETSGTMDEQDWDVFTKSLEIE